MNKRIKELAEQAELTIHTGRGNTYMSHPEFNKKFAELIVAECIDVFSKDLPEDSGKMLEVVNRVCAAAEHFGVVK